MKSITVFTGEKVMWIKPFRRQNPTFRIRNSITTIQIQNDDYSITEMSKDMKNLSKVFGGAGNEKLRCKNWWCLAFNALPATADVERIDIRTENVFCNKIFRILNGTFVGINLDYEQQMCRYKKRVSYLDLPWQLVDLLFNWIPSTAHEQNWQRRSGNTCFGNAI